MAKGSENRILWLLLAALGALGLYRFVADGLFVGTIERGEGREALEALPNVVNPNRASWASLARLPGIGEVLAKRIVAYRDEVQDGEDQDRRAFSKAEDLTNVKGIGEAKAERIAVFLTFEPHEVIGERQ